MRGIATWRSSIILHKQIHDRVLSLGTSAVGTARRLSTVYNSRGMVLTVTTWDDSRVGFGNVQNQVQNSYNDFGQQTVSYQEHSGSVNTSTSPKVQYGYANGSANIIRMTSMTYPSGRGLTYDYGTTNGINDASSRIASIINTSDSVSLAAYQYLGASGFVNATSAQPGITWTLIGTGNDPATGDIYWGLDRFGRVDNCLWQKSSTTLAQIQYGYDRASNRTWRKDGVLTGYDELYSYDGLYRLTDQKRGTLNGTQTAITSGTFEQQWGLDPTGNWKFMKQDDNGNGTWDLVQLRSANKVNEITNVNNTTGSAWATPTYDTAGNMVGIPNAGVTTGTGSTPAWVPMTLAQWNPLTEAQWSAMTETTVSQPQQLSASYDAWNRLVLITNGTQKVIEHVYDARGYRIRKDTYTSGTLTEARHYYYTPGWQCVEERVGTTTTAERQFVWGLRYIDDLVLRDRSTANNGTINERRYAMQDGNWNTIAICDITGSVGERYAYSAYGSPIFMNGSGTVQSASAIGFETLYAGYRWDGATPQMYYVRNRFLMPMIGTWNKRDPLGYVDGMGLYHYAGGDPLNQWDANGLACSSCSDGNINATTIFQENAGGDLKVHRKQAGTWVCQPNPTSQTRGKFTFDEVYIEDCIACTEKCRIRITANRCFHESVRGGDSRDPKNFFTIFQVEFNHTERECGGVPFPDYTTYLNGCELYPGRLVYPGGALGKIAEDYVKSLKSCRDFDFAAFCNLAKKVPPPAKAG